MKLLISSIILFSFCATISYSQDQIDNALYQADSLFQHKKFTQSFDIYQHLLEKEKLVSPAMLLKMAFIKEGLGDYTSALYYLNLYHLQTADKKVLRKMEELAGKRNLQGYNFTDLDVIKSIFYRYFNMILLSLGTVALLLIGLMLYNRIKLGERSVVTGIFAVVILALLFYTINFGRSYHKGIVTGVSTYIMDGPSAGAEVIEVVSKGHRVPLYGQKDVWMETEWEGQKAYVKADKIKHISFL